MINDVEVKIIPVFIFIFNASLFFFIIIISIENIKSSFKPSIIIMINNNDIIIKNNNNIEDNDTFSNVNNHDVVFIWKIIQEEEIFYF